MFPFSSLSFLMSSLIRKKEKKEEGGGNVQCALQKGIWSLREKKRGGGRNEGVGLSLLLPPTSFSLVAVMMMMTPHVCCVRWQEFRGDGFSSPVNARRGQKNQPNRKRRKEGGGILFISWPIIFTYCATSGKCTLQALPARFKSTPIYFGIFNHTVSQVSADIKTLLLQAS